MSLVLTIICATAPGPALAQDPLPIEAPPAGPRVPGTKGYAQALAWLERSLAGRGVPFEVNEIEVERAITTRSDCLLYEDSTTDFAFAGLRERWDERASALPAAYAWNPESADVRGPIVDLGAGRPDELESLVSARVALDGAVGLVTSASDPIDVLSERAREAGLVALLVASPETVAPDDVVLLPHDGGAPLALPCAPVRGVEVELIRARLRAKRIRTPSGAAQTIKAGPGPIEARVAVVCPRTRVTGVKVLRAAGAMNEPLWIDTTEDPSRPAGGAALLLAAARAVSEAGDESRPVIFGPPEARAERAWTYDAPLAPGREALDSGAAAAIGRGAGPRRLPGVLGESLADVDVRLGGELEGRLANASRWIAFGVTAASRLAERPGHEVSGFESELLNGFPGETSQ